MPLQVLLMELECIRLLIVLSLDWEEFLIVDKEIGAGFCIPF
jgi:hypothetical protein